MVRDEYSRAKVFITSKTVKDSLESRDDYAKVKYIESKLSDFKGGNAEMSESTLRHMYHTLADICINRPEVIVQSGKSEEVCELLEAEAKREEKAFGKEHGDYFNKVVERIKRMQKSSHHTGLASKMMASVIIGIGIFSLRSMTGNVMMNVSDISAQAAGSVLMGILAVGAFTLLIPRLTAKP